MVESRVLPGQQRHAVASRQVAGQVLESEVADLGRGRSDEDDSGRCTGFREYGILAEKPIARVDCLRAGRAGGGQKLVLPQVGLRRRP